MLAVTGLNTTLVQALGRLTGERLARIECVPSMFDLACTFELPEAEPVTGWVLAAGVLHASPLWQQTREEVYSSLAVNLGNALRLADHILHTQDSARVVMIGSRSAEAGSFDTLYAACKAGVHAYVEVKPLRAGQQLIAIAPPVIADSGMTRARADYPAVLESRRTVTAVDVAAAIVEAWRVKTHRKVIWL